MKSKLPPHPGYVTKKALASSVKTLASELGEQDACIQLQELSIEYLCNSATATRAPIGDFLKLLYRGNKIPHGTYSFDKLRLQASKSYLIVTYSILERFLRALIAEYRSANPVTSATWKEKSSSGENLSPLLQLAENLPKKDVTILKNAPEFKLLEYYRLVRVANSHIKSATLEKAEKAYQDFTPKDISHFRKYKITDAPNKPDTLSFSDFALFTRAIKYYSKLLNEVCA